MIFNYLLYTVHFIQYLFYFYGNFRIVRKNTRKFCVSNQQENEGALYVVCKLYVVYYNVYFS